MKVEACDICQSTFKEQQVLTTFGPQTFQLEKIHVINMRTQSMGIICSGCVEAATRVLTAFGVPHRYDAYEHKLFIGADFTENLPDIPQIDRDHFEGFWRTQRR